MNNYWLFRKRTRELVQMVEAKYPQCGITLEYSSHGKLWIDVTVNGSYLATVFFHSIEKCWYSVRQYVDGFWLRTDVSKFEP